MKKLIYILLALSVLTISCSKKTDEPAPEPVITSSFSMTYDGVTYTETELNSMALISGVMAIKGTSGEGFLLTIIGVGADGTTTNICVEPSACEVLRNVMLDFGAVAGLEAFVATSGTIKRTGKKIEIEATGIGTTEFQPKSLSATIVASSVMDF